MTDNYYNSIAKGYDELYGKEQTKKINLIKSKISTTKNTKILDIGCGSGISSEFNCNVVGIDPSSELIKIAKEKSKENNFNNHLYNVAKCENIESFKFSDKEFNYIICISAIHHVKNLEKLIPELKRIGEKFIFTIKQRKHYKYYK